jgi:hypothetical protein
MRWRKEKPMNIEKPLVEVLNNASELIQGISGARIDCDHTGRVPCEEPADLPED